MAEITNLKASELVTPTIIETTDGQVYRVRDIEQANLGHFWFGVKQKWLKRHWVDVKDAKVQLIRRDAARRIEDFQK